MKRTSQATIEKNEAIARMKDWLKPGDTVYTILRHVSASGMTRVIDLVIIRDGQPLRIAWNAAKILTSAKWNGKYEGVTVTGCGMDMGFHLVYNLSMALFCPEKYDHDAAYALKHQWL